MTIRLWSTTPASNNSAPPNGWPEGQPASTVNDCGRQMMAETRETCEELPYFDYGDTPTRIDNSNFSVPTNLTTRYAVGNRVKLVGATTGFGRITASVFGAVTTITVSLDSGNVPASLVRVAVNTIAATSVGSATPASVTLSASSVGTRTLASREDHSHTLDQTIAPTWTATHTFSKTGGGSGSAVYVSAAFPFVTWNATGDAANNKRWQMGVSAEQFLFQTLNDADGSAASIMTVDRTGTTVDSAAFPSDGAGGVGGLFRVGTNNSSAGLASCLMQVRTTNAQTTGVFRHPTAGQFAIACHNEATAGDNSFALFGTEAGFTIRGSITYNRAGGVTAYNTTSDRRLKENIRDSPAALSLVAQIRVRAFDWKGMPGSAQRYWLVAQELAEVMPEAVTIPLEEDGLWSIDASKLVPLAVKAMQEQQAEIQQLRDNLQQLISRVRALEGPSSVSPR